MAHPLHPNQIRAARAMLDWSMVDLARAAQISVSTVKRVEHGGAQPVSDHIVGVIHIALKTQGVQFLTDDGSGPGVWLKPRGENPSYAFDGRGLDETSRSPAEAGDQSGVGQRAQP